MPESTARPVKYGLTNVYYAVLDEDGEYGTPKRIYGGVSLTCTPEGDSSTFHADNQPYFVQTVNSGYSGTLEVAYALRMSQATNQTRMACLLSLLMQFLRPLH